MSTTPLPKPAQPKHGHWYSSFRFWISAATVILVGLAVWAAHEQIFEAFRALGRVNLWVLAIIVPLQLVDFWVTGETLFSYLRARGDLRGVHPFTAMRMSLEFNFANHMLPSGGAAGIAYTSWKLGMLGVSGSRSTVAQLVRFAVTFVTFAAMLVVALVILIVEGKATEGVIWPAVVVGVVAVGAVVGGAVLLSRERLMRRVVVGITKAINWVTRLVVRRNVLDVEQAMGFAEGLHTEFVEIAADKRPLLAPLLWSIVINIVESSMFWVAMAAFGYFADPALVFIAYGLATIMSLIVVTPNGAGAYELVMIGYLVAGGAPSSIVIAAVVLARVILLFGNILFGWAFYQHTIVTAGRRGQAAPAELQRKPKA